MIAYGVASIGSALLLPQIDEVGDLRKEPARIAHDRADRVQRDIDEPAPGPPAPARPLPALGRACGDAWLVRRIFRARPHRSIARRLALLVHGEEGCGADAAPFLRALLRQSVDAVGVVVESERREAGLRPGDERLLQTLHERDHRLAPEGAVRPVDRELRSRPEVTSTNRFRL
jgi:hypothetical protein